MAQQCIGPKEELKKEKYKTKPNQSQFYTALRNDKHLETFISESEYAKGKICILFIIKV